MVLNNEKNTVMMIIKERKEKERERERERALHQPILRNYTTLNFDTNPSHILYHPSGHVVIAQEGQGLQMSGNPFTILS